MRDLAVAVLLLVLSTACSTPRVVRLDTGQGTPLEYKPSTSAKSLEVEADDFESSLERLILAIPLPLRSSEQGWLVRASYPSSEANIRWQRLITKSSGGLCEAGHRREDCLSMLDDLAGLDEWDKLGIALSLSLTPLRENISQAVEKTLAPQLFYTVIATGLISWVALAANPEPIFTKAAAITSVLLLIYLGVDTFLELVSASRELKQASDNATLPWELKQASQRFANRVGPVVARVAVLAVTVGVTYGTTGGAALLASRLSMLPHLPEAATMGASQLGINLASVGQVRAVAVVGNTVIISLPATAVAMAAGDEPSTHVSPTKQGANYRETFFAAHPSLRDKVVVHHAIEQQVLKRYPGMFTEAEIHALGNLRGIPKSANPELHLSKIRRAWNDFYRTHARPTKQVVLDFAAQLDRQFGALFDPPL